MPSDCHPSIIILCAGFGVRMLPSTATWPKQLITLEGRPALDYTMDALRGALGPTEQVTLLTNERYLSSFQEWADMREDRAKFRIRSNNVSRPEDAVGSIQDLADVAKHTDTDDGYLVIHGDSIVGFDVSSAVSSFRRKGTTVVTTTTPSTRVASQHASILCDHEGRITDLVEKATPPLSHEISIGIYLFQPRLNDDLSTYLDQGRPKDGTGNFIKWLVDVSPVFAFPLPERNGTWMDVGSPASDTIRWLSAFGRTDTPRLTQ